MKVIAIVVALVASAIAAPTDVFGDLPECAKPAMSSAISHSGCPDNNLDCLCKPLTFDRIKVEATSEVIAKCGIMVAKSAFFLSVLLPSYRMIPITIPSPFK